MKVSLPIFISCTLLGCTAQTYRVTLNPPTQVTMEPIVKDDRLNKDIFITTTTAFNSTHIYHFDVAPSIEDSLSRYIKTNTQENVQVKLQRLDLRSKIGFGVPNQSTCETESLIEVNNSKRIVKSFAENKGDMSSRVQSIGKAILDQCFDQHGRDIAKNVETQSP